MEYAGTNRSGQFQSIEPGQSRSTAQEALGYLDSRKRKQSTVASSSKTNRVPAAAIGGSLASGAAYRNPQASQDAASVPLGLADSVADAETTLIERRSLAAKQARSLFSNPLNRVDYTSPKQAAYEAEISEGVAAKKSAMDAARNAALQQLSGAIRRLGSDDYEREGAAMAAKDLQASAARSAAGYASDGGVIRLGVYTPMPAMADAMGSNLASGQQQRTTEVLRDYNVQQDSRQAGRLAAYEAGQAARQAGAFPKVDPNIVRLADLNGLDGPQRDEFIYNRQKAIEDARHKYGVTAGERNPVDIRELVSRRKDLTEEDRAKATRNIELSRIARSMNPMRDVTKAYPQRESQQRSELDPILEKAAKQRQEQLGEIQAMRQQRRAAEEARAVAMAQNAQMQGLIGAALTGNRNAASILDTMAVRGDTNAKLAMDMARMQQADAADNRQFSLDQARFRNEEIRARADETRANAAAALSAADTARRLAEVPPKPGDPSPLPHHTDLVREQIAGGIDPAQAEANARSIESISKLTTLSEAGNPLASQIMEMPPSTAKEDANGAARTADFFGRFYGVASNGSPITPEDLDPEAIMLGLEKEGIQRQDIAKYYRELEKRRGESLIPRSHPAGLDSQETQGLGYYPGTTMKNTLRMDNEMKVLAQLFGFEYKRLRPATYMDTPGVERSRERAKERNWLDDAVTSGVNDFVSGITG